jgi:tRNA threonylcarbamoyladenosine biosynthesis protein TsaB
MADGHDSPLKVLALDSAGSACSAALWQDGRIAAHRFAEMEHGHAEALIPMVQAVMGEAGIAYSDLDLIAAGTGPGSYTGVRVGLAAARAIASAAGKPLTGVSNFDAMLAACAPDVPQLVALDTRRADLYIQLFAPNGQAESPPTIIGEDRLADLFGAVEHVLIAGDAAPRAANLLTAAGRTAKVHASAHHADARCIARLAIERWQREGKTRTADPIYLRPPDARTVAERAAAKRALATNLVAASAAHGPVLATLQQRCFDERWAAEAMTALLAQPGVAGTLLVAADSQVPLGYGVVRSAAGEAEILTFGVDPRYRRAGHGRRILADMIGRARDAGAEMVFLEVAAANKAARTLYEAAGFAMVGRRPGYYRGPRGVDDGLTYRLDLRISAGAEPNDRFAGPADRKTASPQN